MSNLQRDAFIKRLKNQTPELLSQLKELIKKDTKNSIDTKVMLLFQVNQLEDGFQDHPESFKFDPHLFVYSEDIEKYLPESKNIFRSIFRQIPPFKNNDDLEVEGDLSDCTEERCDNDNDDRDTASMNALC